MSIVTSFYSIEGLGLKNLTRFELQQVIQKARKEGTMSKKFMADVVKTQSVVEGKHIPPPPLVFHYNQPSTKETSLLAIAGSYGLHAIKNPIKVPRIVPSMKLGFSTDPDLIVATLKDLFPQGDLGSLIKSRTIVSDSGLTINMDANWAVLSDFEEELEEIKDTPWSEVPIEKLNFLKDLQVTLVFQSGIPDIKGNLILPTYKPVYRSSGYDREWLNTLHESIASDRHIAPYAPEYQEAYRKMYMDLYDTADTFYLGNGTPKGQFGRLKSVWDVYDNTRTDLFSSLSLEEYAKTMDIYFPHGVGIALDATMHMGDFLEMGLLKVNLDADAGIIWQQGGKVAKTGTKRKDLVDQDFLLSEMMIKAFHENPKQAAKDYSFCLVTGMKNKEEVYEQSDLEKKTRNYGVYNSFSQMPAQVLFTNAMKTAPIFVDDYDEESKSPLCSRSLIGFSHWHYGLTNLLVKFLDMFKSNGRRPRFLVYADNLYMLHDVDGAVAWVSLDGSKMEASHDIHSIKLEAQRVFKTNERSGSSLPVGWKNYFTEFFPQLVVNSLLCIGSSQYPSKMMASGVMGTAYFNSSKMMFLAAEAERLGIEVVQMKDGALVLTDAFQSLCRKIGIMIKLEAFQLGFEDSIRKVGTRVRLDLLGFDGLVLNYGAVKVVAPVLSYNRILKSMLFRKRHYDEQGLVKKTLTAGEAALLTLVRMQSLYYLGGWSYTPLNYEIQKKAKIALKAIKATYPMEMLQQRLNELESQGLLVDEELFDPRMIIATLNNNLEIPTAWEVASLIADCDTAYDFVIMQAAREPMHVYALVPNRLIPYLMKDRRLKDVYNTLEVSFGSDKYQHPSIVLNAKQNILNSVLHIDSQGIQITEPLKFVIEPALPYERVKPSKGDKPKTGLVENRQKFENWLAKIPKGVHLHIQVAIPRKYRDQPIRYDSVDKLSRSLLSYALSSNFRLPERTVWNEYRHIWLERIKPHIFIDEVIIKYPKFSWDNIPTKAGEYVERVWAIRGQKHIMDNTLFNQVVDKDYYKHLDVDVEKFSGYNLLQYATILKIKEGRLRPSDTIRKEKTISTKAREKFEKKHKAQFRTKGQVEQEVALKKQQDISIAAEVTKPVETVLVAPRTQSREDRRYIKSQRLILRASEGQGLTDEEIGWLITYYRGLGIEPKRNFVVKGDLSYVNREGYPIIVGTS